MTDINKEEVDLTDVEIQQCPYDAYKKLRDNAPVYQDPKTGFLLLLDMRMLGMFLKILIILRVLMELQDKELKATLILSM